MPHISQNLLYQCFTYPMKYNWNVFSNLAEPRRRKSSLDKDLSETHSSGRHGERSPEQPIQYGRRRRSQGSIEEQEIVQSRDHSAASRDYSAAPRDHSTGSHNRAKHSESPTRKSSRHKKHSPSPEKR